MPARYVDQGSALQRKFLAADTTPEAVFPRASAKGLQRRSRFTFDPATGALIVTPDLDREIRKAIMRTVRRLKFRLYLRSARLQAIKLKLKIIRALLHFVGYLRGDSLKLRSRTHFGRSV